MSRDKNYKAQGCITVTSIAEAIATAKKENKPEIFIIGGAEIYAQLLPKIERIYLTIVHGQFEGDTHFPEIVSEEWEEVDKKFNLADAENPYDYSFIELDRIPTIRN